MWYSRSLLDNPFQWRENIVYAAFSLIVHNTEVMIAFFNEQRLILEKASEMIFLMLSFRLVFVMFGA